MVSGLGLQQQLDEKVGEIKLAVSGLSEEQASKPPADGEWSAKEVLSHLSGSDSTEFVARLKCILDEDTPRIDVTPRGFALRAAQGRIHQSAPLSGRVRLR